MPFLWFTNEHCRNNLMSMIAGIMFFSSWWFMLDVEGRYYDKFPKEFHLCGMFNSFAFIMLSSVPFSQMHSDNNQNPGCCSYMMVRFWLFVGFLICFGTTIGSFWIMVAVFCKRGRVCQWPGVGMFLHNLLILLSALLIKFGRKEEDDFMY